VGQECWETFLDAPKGAEGRVVVQVRDSLPFVSGADDVRHEHDLRRQKNLTSLSSGQRGLFIQQRRQPRSCCKEVSFACETRGDGHWVREVGRTAPLPKALSQQFPLVVCQLDADRLERITGRSIHDCSPRWIARYTVERATPNKSAISLVVWAPVRCSCTRCFSCEAVNLGLRPRSLPAALAIAMPSRVRARIRSASNSATMPRTLNKSRPTGPVGS